MMEEFEDLKIKLEFIQNNILEIKLYLEESKQSKSHKISPKVFDLHKETTNCAKEVSQQLKTLAVGSDFKEMQKNRKLMSEFLSTLSDLSSLQRLIIEKSVINHDCVDCGTKFRAQTSDDNLLSQLFRSNKTYLWLSIGVAVVGSITFYRALSTE